MTNQNRMMIHATFMISLAAAAVALAAYVRTL